MTDLEILAYPRTDLGNRERFIDMFAPRLCYCNDWKSWLTWNPPFWRRDNTSQVYEWAIASVRRMLDAAEHTGNDKAKEFAITCQSVHHIEAIPRLARHHPRIQTYASQFDNQHHLLNCANGTLDLTTGELYPATPRDYLTKTTGIAYDPEELCPCWDRFLNDLFEPEVLHYVQRIAGYAFSGWTSEKAVFCFVGNGDNGKTTMLGALRYVAGDYGGAILIESLLADQRWVNPVIDLANLQGKRFVQTTGEPPADAVLDEARAKQISSGGGPIMVMPKYKNSYEFSPVAKIFIDANHDIRPKQVDQASLLRLHLVPFLKTIAPRRMDHRLSDKLRNEAPGILRWIVDGALLYQEAQLTEPPSIEETSRAMRQRLDVVSEFLAEECVPCAKGNGADLTPFYTAVQNYAREMGISLTFAQIRERMEQLHYERKHTMTRRFWEGVLLRNGSYVR